MCFRSSPIALLRLAFAFAAMVLVLQMQAQLTGYVRYGSAPRTLPVFNSDSTLFGRAIASIGDLNGDGVEEIAVSALQWNDSVPEDVIHIIFMNANGAMDSIRVIGPDDPVCGELFASGHSTGTALATVGDLNNDGIPDLLVGSPGCDTGGAATGAVHVLFLQADGGVQGLRTFDKNSTGTTSPGVGSGFGSSICAIGDLDLDGRPELFIGAPNDATGGSGRGAGFVLFLNDSLTVRTTKRLAWQLNGMGNVPSADGDHFGSAVCGVGDINADGVPDVMVSAKNSAEGGTVHLLHLTLGGTVRSVKKVRNADTSPIPGVLADVGFGTSMALMKRNGHVSQVLIGSPLANVGHGQLWLLAVDSAGLVTSTHSVLDTVASATTTLPYLPGDGFGAAVALGADLDGNGSRDLWVAAPNATLTSMLRGNLWSIFTTPLTEDPRIRTVITTLTEDKTASGTAYALLEGFGANMPTLEWNTGEASGLHFQKIEEGSFQLSAERPGYSPLVKFYTMGFNAHWNFQNETELHKKNIKHDREGQQQLKAKANNTFGANQDAWFEYEVEQGRTDAIIGFSRLDQFGTDHRDIECGLYISSTGTVYRIFEGNASYLCSAFPGDVLKVQREGATFSWRKDTVILHQESDRTAHNWFLFAGLHGLGSSLNSVRVSHVPALEVSMAVQHTTLLEPGIGAVQAKVQWGKGPYTYAWSNGGKTNSLMNLRTGTYSVSVMDAIGTTIQATATVATSVTIFPTDGIRYENDELFKIGDDGWEEQVGLSENSIAPSDSGWVQLTISDESVVLTLALSDTSSNVRFVLKTEDQKVNALFEGSSGATLIHGTENEPFTLVKDDVIGIQRELSGQGAVINFLLNGMVFLAYEETTAEHGLILELDLASASGKARNLVGRFSLRGDLDLSCETPWNYRITRRYREDGSLSEYTKIFLDHLGRPVQTQTRDLVTGNILVSQTVYDRFGRPALQTLPAPSYNSRLDCYRADFIKASNGSVYSANEYDRSVVNGTAGEQFNPMGVQQTTRGTLGWYYSNNNTSESHVAASAYPFTRILYHHDALGKPMVSHAPGEAFVPGSGHGTKQFTFNGSDILPRFSHGTEWGSLNVHKTISIDPDGQETISYSNEEGQILATCRSGMAVDCPLQHVRTRMETDGEKHVDIHVPASQKQVHGAGNAVSSVRLPKRFSSTFQWGDDQVEYRLMDIESGRVLQEGVDYSFVSVGQLNQYVKFFGPYASNSTYLRVSYELNLAPSSTGLDNPYALWELPDQEVWYTLDYGHWSLYQYSPKGELITVIPPEGVDCDIEYQYISESYSNDDGNWISFCSWNGNDRLPRTVDDVIGSVVFDLSDHLPSTIPLDQNTNADRSLTFLPMLCGTDPHAVSPDPNDDYLSVYDIPVYIPPGRETECGFVYHSPSTPVPVVSEKAKFNFVRSRQQVIEPYLERMPNVDEFRAVLGRPKSFSRDLPDTNGPFPGPGPVPNSDPCAEAPAQLYATYRIRMGYYGVDENDIETLIGNGHEMFTSLMVDCECNMYWTSTPPIPTTIEQFQIEGYSNLRMKLESVHVLTTNDWTDFTPYNQTNYKHDLARFLGMSLTVTVHTTPIPTDPEHRMQQTYEYDGLSQLIKSNDPDRGTTEMVYDQRGQLRFSQNAQQREVVDGKQRFSFVDYDGAGRTVRTGVYAYVHDDQQYMQWRGPLDPPWNVNEIFCTRTPFVLNDMPPLLVQHCEEVSSLVYDAPDPEFPTLLFPALAQRLPPGALSSSKNDESATWYSYDVRGRLHWTVHYTNGLNKYHTVKYEYDLRGQLAHVLYQEEMPEERFDHWYRYDNNGRLLRVLTGNDGLLANATEQAQHSYYAHGPLKRTELGEDLQGLDFVYTLQGWLKTMNSPDANERDPGRDGQLGSNHANFTPDLFGLALDYYNGDYARAGSKITASVLSATDQTAPQRYNGLVRAQRWNNRTMSDPGTYEQGGQNLLYAYQYDALGQLTQAQFATVNAPVQDQNSTYLPPSYTPSTNYKLWNLTYDKNGNLQTLDRNGRGEGLAMDQLAYTYALDGNGHKTNNRLLQVTDEVNTSAYHTSFQLPAGQGSNNYSYNAMGQLTGDALEGKYYTYYANGRVKAVHADAARTQTLASFTYDAAGNRLLKVAYATDGTTPTERTWYLRDGSGGVMSYAIEDVALQTTTEELPIAGVGSYLRASLRTRYEVSDHLGNTRVSFTTDGNGDVLVIEAHDYYPHGGLLPGRQLSGTGGSPLAYQGQEYDPEVGLTAFNLRQYDGRIGRWLTTDPYGQHHSPYLAMSNNPVSFVDPDGGYDQRDRLIDEIWDSGLGLSAAFSNWDEYYLYRDEQDQYDQGYMVEDYQAYYSYQYCQWRQVVTIGGRSESVLMQTKRSHERINVYISRRHMTTGERIYERVSRNLKQRPGYFDGMGTEMASGFMETLHTSLDLVGMAPGIGEGADVVNGLIYLAEGDRWNAGISFAGAAVVVGGQAITGARLMAKGTAGAAKTATRWGPTTGAGPLGERIAATFRGGSYTEMVTQEATTLYRAYGGNAEELGSYWTRTAPTGPLQTRIDGALLPKWGNTAESVSRITVPKGTTIYDGFAAPQGNLMGGGSQVFIPQVNPQWLVK